MERTIEDLAETSATSISLEDLYADPYPAYRWLRENAPVAWVPAAGRFLVTRYEDIVFLERNPEIFSANERGSLMTRIMGHTLLRKDGPEHLRERKAAEPALRPRMVKEQWLPLFQHNADRLLDELHGKGKADLFHDFAGPLAAINLAQVLGFRDVSADDMQRWSQAMMDGGGNYADDPAVWARADQAAAEIDAAIAHVVPHLKESPDGSVISAMVNAEDPLSMESIRANVKVFIGGGLNEPRDSISVAAYALLVDPAARRDVEEDPILWKAVFEEAVRWVAPIGMYPREVTQDIELGGIRLKAGDRLGVCIGSANRDESIFEQPDEFVLHRSHRPHIAFGGGPHFCLGTWVARAQVGQVALPTLFRRLKGLRLDPERPAQQGGWVFRGMTELPAVWDV